MKLPAGTCGLICLLATRLLARLLDTFAPLYGGRLSQILNFVPKKLDLQGKYGNHYYTSGMLLDMNIYVRARLCMHKVQFNHINILFVISCKINNALSSSVHSQIVHHPISIQNKSHITMSTNKKHINFHQICKYFGNLPKRHEVYVCLDHYQIKK